jgi:hypothetical protein
MKAFDTYEANIVAEKSAEIAGAGVKAVGMYYFTGPSFKTLLTRAIAAALAGHGVSVFSFWECGYPTHSEYFNAAHGSANGLSATLLALEAGQPASTPVYLTVDYDAVEADLARIADYFTAARFALRADGYSAGVYGNGLVCRHLKALGLVSHTCLSCSRGFAGYQDWKGHADIVQAVPTTFLGMDIDPDVINPLVSTGGVWMPASK